LRAVIAKKKEEKVPVKKIVPELPSGEEEKVISLEEAKEKPLKRKKAKKKGEKKEATPKSVVRHRKLEVFERADLYEERKGRPKGRKALKKSKGVAKQFKQTEITTPKAIKRRLKVQETVTVAELAKAMGTKAVGVIKKLMNLGVTANINQSVDFETSLVDEFSVVDF